MMKTLEQNLHSFLPPIRIFEHRIGPKETQTLRDLHKKTIIEHIPKVSRDESEYEFGEVPVVGERESEDPLKR